MKNKTVPTVDADYEPMSLEDIEAYELLKREVEPCPN